MVITRIDLKKDWECEELSNGFISRYPNPTQKGLETEGFVYRHEAALDMMDWEGLFGTAKGKGKIQVVYSFANKQDLQTEICIACEEAVSFVVRKEDFPLETVNVQYWQYVTAVKILWEDGVELCENPLLKAANHIFIEAEKKGISGKKGDSLIYSVTVYNCEDKPQMVSTSQVFEGWECIKAKMTPSDFLLSANQSQQVEVAVTIPDTMVPGGHEATRIRFCANGDSLNAPIIELKTLCTLPHPYIYHNEKGWEEVKNKIQNHEEYQPAAEEFFREAKAWAVEPPVANRDYCYPTQVENCLMATGYAYALSGDETYAKKLVQFYRYFTDEKLGYPSKKKGCSMSYVQEGHFFQHLAIPYDLIYDSSELTKEDHKAIEHSFRLYMSMLDKHLKTGEISNWLLSELVGALYCALVIQDMDLVLRFLYGNGGILEQYTKGVFNDGWWHECSVGYNVWVSSMILHTAHAMLPFGYSLMYEHFPIPYNKEVSAVYGVETRKVRFAMDNQKRGGNQKNYCCIKDMYDAALPFLDYRGVLFGISDSFEKKLEGVHWGSTYDLAYFYYQDSRYLSVIHRNEYKDPIFGIPDLPQIPSIYEKNNAYADNIGIAMLRSQKEGRLQRDQIQAVLRYGSHGGAHGHFDITELLSLMRYGKSIFNPEHVWWSYAHFMYKFYVQTSVTKNMVVVDGKMQQPADSKRILFYGGKHLQAVGIQTTCQWSYPPYGGMVYNEDETLEHRCEMNGSSLPILHGEDAPAYGECTEFTEPIIQKRIMAVTDDYIVLFDSLEGEKVHEYASLLQLKGFQGIEGEEVNYRNHTAQWSDDPKSDTQFVTDCKWYEANSPSTAHFSMIYGEGENWRGERTAYNEPGTLNLDVHTAWPPKTTQMLGDVAIHFDWKPEQFFYTIPVRYEIRLNHETVKSGKFGAWILGTGEEEVDIEQAENLELFVYSDPIYNEQHYPVQLRQSLFWGQIHVRCKDGSICSLEDLELERENVDEGYGIGRDYENGRVLIKGEEYPDAVPTSPIDHSKPAIIRISLEELRRKGIQPSSLQVLLGADAFPGDESQLRKTYAVMQRGTKARFITVVEPFENQNQILKVESVDEDTVRIYLKSGKCQTLQVFMKDGEENLSCKEDER